MRRLPALALAILSLCQAHPQSQPSTVPREPGAAQSQPVDPKLASAEGVVISIRGTPIANARVLMAPGNLDLASEQFSAAARTANANERGEFTVAGLSAATYQFIVMAPGYQTIAPLRVIGQFSGDVNFGETAQELTFGEGEHKKGLTISLRPLPTITGRVTDHDGKPASAEVYLVDKSTAQAAHTRVETDENGNYTLGNLNPSARPYLRFTPRNVYVPPEDRPDINADPEPVDIETYYPGVEQLSAAVPVQLINGSNRQDVDVRLLKGFRYRIRAHLAESADLLDERTVAYLVPLDPGQSPFPNASMQNGSVEFAGIPAGRYLLQTDPFALKKDEAREHLLVGQQFVTVSNRNLADVRISTLPVASIPTKVTFDLSKNSPMQLSPERSPQLLLQSPSLPWVAVGLDANLRFASVPPGDYIIRPRMETRGAYVKSLRYEGRAVIDGLLHVSSGSSAPLEIEFAFSTAQVSGVVRDKNQKPVANTRISVRSIRTGLDRDEPPYRGAQITTNTNGEFLVGNLPPGKYSVLAWESIDSAILDIPDFRSKFVTQESTIEVTDSGSYVINPPLIPRAKSDAEAAKYQ